ncbi:MAG: hypothetical protein GC138_07020 [Gammaproteobacteria bacterium]|nr:hypothetical protein [Gammaproteobacteria bacterium]
MNVGGLVATTHDITNDDFMAGNDVFNRNGAIGAIVNDGELNADLGGYIALLAPEVRNQGVIVAQMGLVELAGGETYELQFDGNATLANIRVDAATIDTLVRNGKTVQAPGGRIVLSALAADQLHGSVVNDGDISASSLVNRGGRILLEGDAITLQSGSTVTATGAAGGGEVLVGGDWQGSGDIHQATTVTMQQGAAIDASATINGDGGKVVLWSNVNNVDSMTDAHGSIVARGGAENSDGGRIETSGHTVAIEGAVINAGATSGKAGQWLLDPYDYTIDGTAAGTINSTLDTGTDVTIDTANNTGPGAGVSSNGDITVTSAISKSAGGNATLTLKAARHINLQGGASFSSSNNQLNLLFWADSDNSGDGINQVASTSINTNGGWLKFGNNQTATINGSSVLVGGDVYFNGASAQTISTGGGAVDIYGETIIGNTNGLSINTSGGNVGLHGVLNSGNTYTWVDKTGDTAHDWTWARTDAINGTGGGSAVGDSYLVTITSRLENAIAGLTAGYSGAWIGAYRPSYSTGSWVWADGPESGTEFFSQTTNGSGGTTTSGYYSNFGSGEPNGCMSSSSCEGVGQFYGTAGQWNDLTSTTQFSASQASQYGVLGYVRETNAAASPLSINAGSGSVTIDGGVGGSKALASLDVTAASTTIDGTALITQGTQTFDNGVTINSTGVVNIAGSGLTVTNPGQALRISATGNITLDETATVPGAIDITGDVIALNADLSSALTGGSGISITGTGISQAAGVDVTTGGADINYTVTNAAWTSGSDHAIDIGASGTQATIDAGGGNIDISASFAASGTDGGSDRAILVNNASISTSGSGTIGLTGDATANASTTVNAWGMALQNATIQTDGGAITLTGTGGQASGNARGIVVDGLQAAILSNSGAITLIDRQPVGLTGTYNGLYLRPTSSSNLFIGADGSTVATSSSDITLQADNVSFVANGSFVPELYTSGAIVIEPDGSSFSSAVNTTALNIFGNPSSVTIGKATNTADATLGAIAAAGPISVEAGNISLNSNLNTDATTAGDVLLKARGNITQSTSVTVQTDGGDITYWSNSDQSGDGYIYIGDGANFNSANGLTSSGLSGGGNITFAGGADSNADNLPDGYALSTTSGYRGVTFGTMNGTSTNNTLIYTGGGELLVKGMVSGSGSYDGIVQYGSMTVDSGIGAISLFGESNQRYGIQFAAGAPAGGSTVSLTSAKATGDAIFLSGVATGTAVANRYGIYLNSFPGTSTSTKSFNATGGGNINITGSSANAYGVYFDNGDILSSAGNITLSGGTGGIDLGMNGAIVLGGKSGTAVTSSNANITLDGDLVIFESHGLSVDSTGTFTIQPSGSDFAQAFNTTNLSLSSALAGLTIGKSASGADGTSDVDVTVVTPISIAGPIAAYGGDIAVNGNIDTTAGSVAGDVLLKASGSIVEAASTGITTQGGSAIFWADSDASGSGQVQIGGSVATNGGNLTLAGGADDGSNGGSASDGIPDGYAYGSAQNPYESRHGVAVLAGASLDAGGGDILIRGKTTQGTAFGYGVLQNGSIITSGGGSITVVADASGEGSTIDYPYGLYLTGNSTIQTNAGAINLTGIGGQNTTYGHGVVLEGANVYVQSAFGPITIDASGSSATGFWMNGSGHIGQGTLGSSSSDITINADTVGVSGGQIKSSGPLLIQPRTAGTSIGIAGGAGTLQLSAANFSSNFANGFSGITVGNASAGDITVGTSTLTYNDTLTLKTADNITVSGGASLTGGVGEHAGLVLWSDADATNGGYVKLANTGTTAPITTNGGGLWIGGGSGTASWTPYIGGGALTVGDGYAQGTSSYGTGVYLGSGAITTSGGNVAIYGESSSAASAQPDGTGWSSGIYSINAANRNVSIDSGTGSILMHAINTVQNATNGGDALYLNGANLTSAATSGDAITLTGDSSGAYTGSGGRGAGVTMVAWTNETVAVSATGGGNIVIDGTSSSATGHGLNYGVRITSAGASSQISTSNGGNVSITGTSNSSSATYAVGFETSSDSISSSGNLSIVGTNKAIGLAGPVTVTGTTSLTASGHNISAANAGNDFGGVVSIPAAANLDLVDSNAMTLGAVTAVGTVNVATLTGDLTLSGDITTSDATASALTLNAGRNTAAGTVTGGNIVLSGSPSVSVGSGGTARLYTGSIANSTGLTNLVGSGSGNFRYNSDESTTNYTLALATDLNAIYREQPTVTVAVDDQTVTYGTTPSYTFVANGENGDSFADIFSGDPSVSVSGTTSTSGNHIVGTHTLTASGGTGQLGYAISGYTAGTLTVNQKALTFTGTGNNREYDGTTSATVTDSISGAVSGDDVSVGSTSAAFNVDGNVGSGKAITVTGISLSGADMGNYSIGSSAGTTADITAKTVSLSATKTYDGTTALGAGDVSISTGVGSETLTYSGATSSDSHVATVGKYINAITLQDATDASGGVAGNYVLPTLNAANAPVTITAKAITSTASIGGTLTKTYDGTTDAAGASVSGSVNGAITGDTLSLDASGLTLAYDSSHVASATQIGASGSAGFTIDSSTAGSLSTDYSFTGPTIAAASASITTATLTPILTNSGVTKVYDGTTDAPAGFTPSWSFGGLVTGDTAAALSSTGSAYDSSHVANAGMVTVSGLSIDSITGSNSSATTDYGLDATSKNVAATITTKALISSAAIGGTLTKVYDGTTAATAATLSGSVSGAIAGDTLSLDTSGLDLAYDSAHVASASQIAASGSAGFSINSSAAGSLSSDYSFSGPTIAAASASITAKSLTSIATIGGTLSKVYDGTNAASGASLSGSVSGSIAGDTLSLDSSGLTLAYDSSHVTSASKIAASGSAGFSINSSAAGSQSTDYSFTGPTITAATAAITPKLLTSTASIGGTLSKVYDGTNATPAATLSGSVSGAIAGDTLSLDTSGLDLAYDSAHVASASQIAAAGSAGFTIDSSAVGSQSTDYSFSGPTIASVAATITPATLTPTLTNSGVTKVYDGTTDAPAGFTPSWSFGGLAGGDTAATLTDTGSVYDSSHVADAGIVTVSGLAISAVTGSNGSLATDYAVDASSKNVTATITAKDVTVSGLTAADKVYDGTDVVTITDWGSVNTGVSGETLNLTATDAAFVDVNAGNGITVTASGYVLSDGTNALAGDYHLTGTSATTTANIAQVALTVSANNDAKFVTQSDAPGYNGVSYSGFVHGETSTVLGGTLNITRSNAGTDAAGNYAGVLTPAGLTAANYAVNYVSGDYLIVPADQLLVSVANGSVTYGTAPSYTISSAQYLDNSNVITTLTLSATNGNTFTFDDGVGGTATFTLAPANAVDAGSGILAVGNYPLTGINTSIAGGNFNSLNFSGNLAVTQKAVTASAGNVSKVYDGNAAMTNVTIALNGIISGDNVTVDGNGAFGQKDVGANLAYDISGIALSGADGGNYYLSTGASLSGNNGEITPATLTVSGISAPNKVYDGTASTSVDTGGAILNGLVSGDDVSLVASSGAFADKNVGNAKVVTLSNSYGGADLGNYVVTDQATTAADITRLDSVAWVGGATGNWFDPANWAGGAVPDLANVANVLIPAGITVSFDTGGIVTPAQAGTVQIDSLSAAGALTQHDGTLEVGNGGITLNGFIQTGGTLTSGGDFTIDGDFAQGAGGSVTVIGNADITDSDSGTMLGNLTVSGTMNVNSVDGDIVQATGTTIGVDGATTMTAVRHQILLADNNTFRGGLTLDIGAVETPVVIPPPASAQALPTPDSAPAPIESSSAALHADEGPGVNPEAIRQGGIEASTEVILVETPSEIGNGLVKVSVPQKILSKGFSFALPAELVKGIRSDAGITATLVDGTPLPGWLHFAPDTRTFTASAVPSGALPIQVVVNIDGRSSIVVIAEEAE